MTTIDHDVGGGDAVAVDVEVAFPDGTPFQGTLALTAPGGPVRVVGVISGRARSSFVKGVKRLHARPHGLASFAWVGAVQHIEGSPGDGRPLAFQARGGRVILEVRTAGGETVPTFDLLVKRDGQHQEGWEPNYVERLRQTRELEQTSQPFLWLSPGEHLIRVNDARHGLAEQLVSVSENGESVTVRLQLDPAKAIELGRPRVR